MSPVIAITHTMVLQFKVLSTPVRYTRDQMFEAAQNVFAPAGCDVELAGVEHLGIPRLQDCYASPISGQTSSDQVNLYRHRNNVQPREIVIYFVRNLYSKDVTGQLQTPVKMHGVASFSNKNRPSLIVASYASLWTLAHELGHVLGLEHSNSSGALMGSSTEKLVGTPTLTNTEKQRIAQSPYLSRV